MKYSIISLVLFSLVFFSCNSKKDTWKNDDNKQVQGQKVSIPDKNSLIKLKTAEKPVSRIIFPETICGKVTSALMNCHISKVQENKTLADELKNNMIVSIRGKFTRNLKKYISHCEKTMVGLDKKAVDNCLKMECKEMDKCLQKTAGKIN